MDKFALGCLTALFLALAACASSKPADETSAPVASAENVSAETPAPDMAPTCDAGKAQSFVGQVASAEVQAQARDAAGAASVRTLKPNQPTTREFMAQRLNLHVDDAGNVTSVNCG